MAFSAEDVLKIAYLICNNYYRYQILQRLNSLCTDGVFGCRYVHRSQRSVAEQLLAAGNVLLQRRKLTRACTQITPSENENIPSAAYLVVIRFRGPEPWYLPAAAGIIAVCCSNCSRVENVARTPYTRMYD